MSVLSEVSRTRAYESKVDGKDVSDAGAGVYSTHTPDSDDCLGPQSMMATAPRSESTPESTSRTLFASDDTETSEQRALNSRSRRCTPLPNAKPSFGLVLWTISVTLTALWVVDRFTTQLTPRQHFRIGRGTAGGDSTLLKDGPWTVVFYDGGKASLPVLHPAL